MDQRHRQAIARARRGSRQSSSTRSKISKSMKGKKNHLGKTHTKQARDRIAHKRGEYDPIGDKIWIVGRNGKTFRRKHAPEGFKSHKRVYEFVSFKEFLTKKPID